MNKLLLLLIILSLGIGCKMPSEQKTGTVFKEQLFSEILKDTVSYQVYLPNFFENPKAGLPVLYLLHGHGGDEQDWFQPEEGNLAVILDSLIARQIIPPIVAVTVDAGNSWYIDRPKPMETFYLEEFIPYIEDAYPVDASQGRIAAGDSAGGYGALRFSLLKPELFSQVILLSPASYEPLPPSISSSRKIAAFAKDEVFNDSIWKAFSYTHRWENLKNAPKKPTYYLSVGDDDVFNIVPVVTELQQRMIKDSIPNELRITNGGHDWQCWQQNVSAALTVIFSKI